MYMYIQEQSRPGPGTADHQDLGLAAEALRLVGILWSQKGGHEALSLAAPGTPAREKCNESTSKLTKKRISIYIYRYIHLYTYVYIVTSYKHINTASED